MAKLKASIVPTIETKALRRFLEDRCIPLELAQRYCFEAVMYCRKRDEDVHYLGFLTNNLGLVYKAPWGLTGSRNSGITTFTGDGMRCTRVTSDRVLVFSGFMDFLSYLALEGLEEPTCDVLVLNGCSNVEKGMRFLRQHGSVHCYLSLDERGRRCQRRIEDSLEEGAVCDCSAIYDGEEDLGGLLVKVRGRKSATAMPKMRRVGQRKPGRR